MGSHQNGIFFKWHLLVASAWLWVTKQTFWAIQPSLYTREGFILGPRRRGIGSDRGRAALGAPKNILRWGRIMRESRAEAHDPAGPELLRVGAAYTLVEDCRKLPAGGLRRLQRLYAEAMKRSERQLQAVVVRQGNLCSAAVQCCPPATGSPAFLRIPSALPSIVFAGATRRMKLETLKDKADSSRITERDPGGQQSNHSKGSGSPRSQSPIRSTSICPGSNGGGKGMGGMGTGRGGKGGGRGTGCVVDHTTDKERRPPAPSCTRHKIPGSPHHWANCSTVSSM